MKPFDNVTILMPRMYIFCVFALQGVATVLYGEGAMAVVGSVLNQCSAALQSSSNAYGT